ncbi:hypothetical protein BTHE_1528, partial [Bifidobacterium thermophilum]
GVAPRPWGAGRKSSIGSHAPRPSDQANPKRTNKRSGTKKIRHRQKSPEANTSGL